MITLMELFDVARFPMKDMDSGEAVDSKVVLAHPDAVVEKIGCTSDFEITVRYNKEAHDEEFV